MTTRLSRRQFLQRATLAAGAVYVVDGALIEGSTGLANPSFTIAALAERCMERIVPGLHAGA